ncbi:hypothetical protein BGZ63DRAFT_402711 [Mariannaea sp. PMI_226]|nr:hypothetical protein BGZ63DRAFT_402711 [Mariannaea sp. PMI_226]
MTGKSGVSKLNDKLDGNPTNNIIDQSVTKRRDQIFSTSSTVDPRPSPQLEGLSVTTGDRARRFAGDGFALRTGRWKAINHDETPKFTITSSCTPLGPKEMECVATKSNPKFPQHHTQLTQAPPAVSPQRPKQPDSQTEAQGLGYEESPEVGL